ncbi:MAG: hypothetical protein ACJ79O_14445 [Myxococcales bacterium]
MKLTEELLTVAADAWAAGRDGNGIVITDDYYPAAHRLAEAGCLERRSEPNGDLSWWDAGR